MLPDDTSGNSDRPKIYISTSTRTGVLKRIVYADSQYVHFRVAIQSIDEHGQVTTFAEDHGTYLSLKAPASVVKFSWRERLSVWWSQVKCCQ
ncbi:hypothetical protein CC1G_15473 [Coprinopsis cinerea okayama7|uniref:Uncharacterized protein n=1 Tax=Coprinopsis cinerea (strain Okayama-7 / 130 / ATCC MYA-4618 / FGSC 9003) TaxID=240176 RepID=D6RQV7_COPC7|nr:hypothetical protein CC1G_15473 [Coprinopsis cinerea okayama7\|eukprot:XP_002910196.1 hypothetical protein CC1G_15473 [Coprinopsis cinerea okayama7\